MNCRLGTARRQLLPSIRNRAVVATSAGRVRQVGLDFFAHPSGRNRWLNARARFVVRLRRKCHCATEVRFPSPSTAPSLRPDLRDPMQRLSLIAQPRSHTSKQSRRPAVQTMDEPFQVRQSAREDRKFKGERLCRTTHSKTAPFF